MRPITGGVVALLLLVACSANDPKPVIIGAPDESTTTALPRPEIVAIEPPTTLPRPQLGRAPIPEPGPARGLKLANGRPFKPAIEFRSDTPVPSDLLFVLVLGSDARPKEDLRRSRADSIHLLAVNPSSGQGTLVGIPRDAYVEIPGRGRGKINDAMARGGPKLMAETVRRLTGLPIHFYLLTGFTGLTRMVDDLGGVDVFVSRRMNDRLSGARFEAGWHHFNGAEALAYTRNRHDVEYGDFSRSENQGNLILAALSKLRSEVGEEEGLVGWLRVFLRNVELDVPADQVLRFAVLGRRLDPTRVTNVTLPGRVGMAGGASVVFLTQDAATLFVDLRDDAVIGAALPPTTLATTTTTAPAAATTSTTEATAVDHTRE